MSKKLQVRIVLTADAAVFSQERTELKNFVDSLNEEKSSVHYELVTEEALEEDVGQAFYLLIGQEFPEEESGIFHQVYDRFRQTGAPAMYTYFRRKDSDPLTDSVKAFMTELDEEIGHFFSLYEDLDSVKLGILMELARASEMEDAFAVSGGAAFFRQKKVLSLEQLPFYQNNEGLQALLKEQKELADRFEKAAVALAHDPENRDFYAEKEEISRRQKEVFDALEEQEKALRDLLLEIARRTGGVKGLTSSEKLAVRELEKGAYENAEQILRKADRSLAHSPAGAMLAADKQLLAGYVSENRLLIKTLMASGVTAERADEICSCWEETLRLTKEYGLDPVQVAGYPEFLIHIGDDHKALEVLSLIEKLYILSDVPEEEQAGLSIDQGIVYSGMPGKEKEAEKSLIFAVKMLRELEAKHREDKNIYAMLINACFNLGVLEEDKFRKHEQAARYLKEAEEGYLKLCEEDEAYWETRLSMVYQAQGRVFKEQRSAGSYKKAAERYEKALEICERRAEKDLMGMGQQLAENYLHYSDLCIRQNKLEQAYLLAEQAWRVYDKMARISPALYKDFADMARSRMVDTGFYEMQNKKEDLQTHLKEIERLNKQAIRPHVKVKEKKFCLEKALKHCAVLEENGVKDPAMGDIYANYGKMISGEASDENLAKAWGIYRDSFDRFPQYCLTAMNKLLAIFGERGRKNKDSEKYLPLAGEALDLLRKHEEIDFSTESLTDLHGSCGDLFWDCRKLRDAEQEYLLVEKYLLKQKENNPASEKLSRQMKENAYRLRHMYISRKVEDSYSEEELERLLGEFTGIPGILKKTWKILPAEDKYSKIAGFFEKNGVKLGKRQRSFKDADECYQIAKVLYRQLDDAFPGKYKDKINAVDEKIADLHSHWKEE